MNRNIQITQRGYLAFKLAMQVAWLDIYDDKGDKLRTCDTYKIRDNSFIICDRSDKEDAIKLPFAMSQQETIDFVWAWLNKTEPTENKYNGDGSYEKAFTVTGINYGNDWREFISVKPSWMYYGK